MQQPRTVFGTTLRPVLTAAKFLGIISFSCTTTDDGLVSRNTPSPSHCTFLEFTRTFLLLVFTYHHFHSHPLQRTFLFKFWVVIVVSRMSEAHTMKLINGIIELNRKSELISFPRRRQPSETRWLVIFGATAVYFIIYHVLSTNTWSLKTLDAHTVTKYLFGPPFFVDLVIIVSACFYLGHINSAFQTLIDICDEYLQLPKRFGSVVPECRWRLAGGPNRRVMRKINFSSPETKANWCNAELLNDRWTRSAETAIVLERIRLHHAELFGLLKTFDACYGPQLLSFFAFSFADSLIYFYWTVCMKLPFTEVRSARNLLRTVLQFVLFGQNIVLMTSAVVAAYYVDQKKKKIMSYLRLIQISKLSADIKRQVKMFMNQMLDLELDKITAFGFFNINSNLIVSMLVLLFTGIAILMQMKEHQFIQQFVNRTAIFVTNMTEIN